MVRRQLGQACWCAWLRWFSRMAWSQSHRSAEASSSRPVERVAPPMEENPAGEHLRACVAANARSYRSVESVLKSGLDAQPVSGTGHAELVIEHENVRGPDYFN